MLMTRVNDILMRVEQVFFFPITEPDIYIFPLARFTSVNIIMNISS